jgi:AAA family ATP:ADP antiporter
MTSDTKRRSWIERGLGIFAEVRPGEGLLVLLLTLDVFLLLASYYVIKTLRESQILSRGMLGLTGPELKAYATAAQALLLLGVIPAYGALASRVNRIRLINITTLIFMGCLIAFFLLAGPLGLSIGLAYYLWVGIFNVFVIAQFWSYANDLYDEGQGKRLFPIIAVGGSVGAILGPFITSAARQYPYQLMLASAGVLGLCMALYNLVNWLARPGAGGGARPVAGRAEAPLSKEGGFLLVVRQRYLLLIALMLTVANFVNTTGEYLLSDRVSRYAREQVPDDAFAEVSDADQRAAAVKQARGAIISDLYGKFFGLVNLLSFLIQAFAVSRVFKYLGVRVALLVLPLVALGGYALIALLPTMAVVRAAKLAENSTDYSLQNTVRQALFLPTSREAKYKAKAAIDTFFVRFGDAAAALLVFAGIHWLGFTTRSYALTCVVALALLLVIVAAIIRQHRALTAPAGE